MNKTERDNLILRMAAGGQPTTKISEATGLSYHGVRSMLDRNRHFITDRLPPAGMRVRTACLVFRTVGIWPEADNAEEVADRRPDFQRGGTKRTDWNDLDAWLARASVRS